MSADDVGVSKKRRVRAIIVFNVAATLAVLLAVELGVTFMLNHPDRLSGPLLHFARRYYAVYDRVCVQACSLYARYDKDVTYTLRPGIWRDTAREFRQRLHSESRPGGFRQVILPAAPGDGLNPSCPAPRVRTGSPQTRLVR